MGELGPDHPAGRGKNGLLGIEGYKPEQARRQSRRSDRSRRHLREDAMYMLGDDDGTTLASWIEVFKNDREEFLTNAEEWVEHCNQADTFGLFK